MVGPRDPAAICASKIAYSSKAKAAQAVISVRNDKQRRLQPYHCPVCNKYHLARKNPDTLKRGCRIVMKDGPRKGEKGVVVGAKVGLPTVEVRFDGSPYIIVVPVGQVLLVA